MLLAAADNLNAAADSAAEALKNHDSETVRDLLARTIAAGADILDLNLGFRSRGAPKTADWLVRCVADATNKPLILDTADPEAMRAGLEAAHDLKLDPLPIINSFSLDPQKIAGMLPLAAEFNTSIVGYCVRDVVPQTPEERLEVALELVALADEAGVPRHDLYLDPILFPISSFQGDVENVLGFFPAIRELFNPPVKTMVGLSNAGHRLHGSARTRVEATLLSMLAALGLDIALLNILDPELADTITALRSLRGDVLFAPADLERHPKLDPGDHDARRNAREDL